VSEWETILTQPVAQALGWALLHSLWQGTAVALLLAGLLLLLRRNVATVRYAAACAALLLMLLAPVLTFQLMRTATPSEAAPASSSSQLISEASTRSVETTLGAAATPPLDAMNEARQQSWQRRLSRSLETLLPWSTLLWLAGVLALSLRLLGGTIYMRRIKSRETRPVEVLWTETLESLAVRLRVMKTVSLLESRLALAPMAIGWLRPVILLPTSVLTGLTAQQLEAILAHELAHIRRHDYLVNLCQSIVETLFFYHPAVWWVSRRIRIEREYCCDDLAVAACGDPLVYARALTRLERFRKLSPQLAIAANGGLLMNRIQRLVGMEAPRSSRFGGPLAVVFVISIVVAFVAMTPTSLISKAIAKQGDSNAFNAESNAHRTGAVFDNAVFVARSDFEQSGAARDAEPRFSTQENDERASYLRRPEDAPGMKALLLGRQDEPAADVAAKIKALDSSSPQERAAAACSLGKMRALEAIPFLIQKLGDDASIGAFRCWDSDTWSPALDIFKEPSAGEQAAIALAAMGKFSVEPLTAALGDANASVRRNAAWAIGEIRGGNGVDRAATIGPLLAALNNSDAWVRKAAAFTLGEIRDERASEPLINALDDAEPQVRDMAARALGEMKEERAVRQLIARLGRDQDASVRSRSAWALGEMKASAATEALTAALKDDDQQVRSETRTALAEILD
jgi:beta-lactamase regulating signal transducer with metallopeptidase domain/HEAT repeat protein